jgi:hypothetical protein
MAAPTLPVLANSMKSWGPTVAAQRYNCAPKRAISCASWPPAREFNEKGTAYAKETYGKTQATAGEVTKVIEQTYSTASKPLRPAIGVPPVILQSALDVVDLAASAPRDTSRTFEQLAQPVRPAFFRFDRSVFS